MLIELNVRNFALIDNVKIEFQKGLNILTGETGAGKSILVDALCAVLGGYFGSDYIKDGENISVIEALFDVSGNNLFEEFIQDSEGKLIISRDITRTKGSIYRLQGRITTLSSIKSVAEKLVDIHSQFENQSLLNVRHHLTLLDMFGGEKIKKIKDEVKNSFEKWTELKKTLYNLKKEESENIRNYDIAKFQYEEIERANLKIGEDKECEEKLTFLQNAEKIISTLNFTYDMLYKKENSVIECLQLGLKKVKEIKEFDSNLNSIFENIQNSLVCVEEASSLLQKYINNFEFDATSLQQVDDRLNLIRKLKKKYGETIEEILNYKEKIKSQIDSFENKEERIKEIEKEIEIEENNLATKCIMLSKIRQDVAKVLKAKVEENLQDLAMKGSVFDVSIKQKEDKDGIDINGKMIKVQETGIDEVEFLISPNIGEIPKPLNKIASGGELSRVMLAIKVSLQDVDKVPVLIFDEVDAGIGGEAGVKIGEKLYQLSKNHQVICITHLPTIAAFGDNHIMVSKDVSQNKTKITVSTLTKDERIKEISRMLRGSAATKITKDDAEELLCIAEKKKRRIERGENVKA